jgi:peptidoglycan/xylan/chitin deacetylase (PgdA/CDA1 family)
MANSPDPRVPGDVTASKLWLTKAVLTLLGSFGTRRILKRMFPAPSVSHFDVRSQPGVKGYVALTIDDAFHSGTSQSSSMLTEVRELLKEHRALATFFVMLDGCTDLPDDAVSSLLADGHELGNHLISDRPYDEDPEADLEQDLTRAQQTLEQWMGRAPTWFRAPHGKLSDSMKRVLERHGLTNAMMDCYAHDPFVPDPQFLAQFMAEQATDGSILLIHMPERGFREWNLEALGLLLAAIAQKGLEPITLSELAERARNERPR